MGSAILARMAQEMALTQALLRRVRPQYMQSTITYEGVRGQDPPCAFGMFFHPLLTVTYPIFA